MVMAIAPPTRIATIGTNRPPKLVTASTNLIRRLRQPTGRRRYNSGGADRDRTGGLLVANQALSQLSYSPNPRGQGSGYRG